MSLSTEKFRLQSDLLEEEYQISKELQRLFQRRQRLNENWLEIRADHQSEEVVLDGFPQFARFPIELRTIIWGYTIEPQVLQFNISKPEPDYGQMTEPAREAEKHWTFGKPTAQAISRVCHESREVFLKHYLAIEVDVKHAQIPSSRFFMSPTLDTWFFDVPGLDFGQDNPAEHVDKLLRDLGKYGGEPDLASKIKKIALNAVDWDVFSFGDHEWDIISSFSGLQEVIFVENRVEGYDIEGDILYFTEYCPRHRREHHLRKPEIEDYRDPFHECALNTGPRGQGNKKTFLAPFHTGELLFWEATMSVVGCITALSPRKEWATVRTSVARLMTGAELERKGPLVNFEGVRFGPPNVHWEWLEWKEAQEQEQEQEIQL